MLLQTQQIWALKIKFSGEKNEEKKNSTLTFSKFCGLNNIRCIAAGHPKCFEETSFHVCFFCTDVYEND